MAESAPLFPAAEKICQHCREPFRRNKRAGISRYAGRLFCSRDCWRSHVAMLREVRFWDHIQKRKPNECWPWRGRVSNSGYGAAYFNGRATSAARIALHLSGAFMPAGKFVLHSCDNKLCCNPAHLRWGTAQENADDREGRGRGRKPRGEQHGQAKLTEEDVRYIRRSGRPPREMARELGVSDTVVYLARQGRTWRHVV
jgi:hypothetical protein